MLFEAAFILRYGIQHTCDTVRDIVPHSIAHIQGRDNHAHGRQQYVQPVASGDVDGAGGSPRYVVNGNFKHQSGQAAQYTYQQCQEHCECAFLDMLLAPYQKSHECFVESVAVGAIYGLFVHILNRLYATACHHGGDGVDEYL